MLLQQKKTESHLAACDQLRVWTGQIPSTSSEKDTYTYTQRLQPAHSAKLQPYLQSFQNTWVHFCGNNKHKNNEKTIFLGGSKASSLPRTQ